MYHYVDQRNHPADMLHDSPDWRKLFQKKYWSRRRRINPSRK